MGFVRTLAKVGSAATSPFGLAALALGKKKKKPEAPKPTMISTSYERPTSLIGPTRSGGGY